MYFTNLQKRLGRWRHFRFFFKSIDKYYNLFTARIHSIDHVNISDAKCPPLANYSLERWIFRQNGLFTIVAENGNEEAVVMNAVIVFFTRNQPMFANF